MAQETITTKEILRQSLDRNRYFYGMLMTVRDFTMEQNHFTAKRFLSNRLLFGSGVICGLQVEKSGPEATTIEIKPGVAFDPLGREVTVLDVPGGNEFDLSKVIPAPSPTFTGDKKGFICLSHRECPKDPVPSLKSSPCDEICEASRWNETFDVTWNETTTATPQPSICEKWLNRTTAVAENAEFRIERTTPLWVRPEEVFEVVVRVTAKEPATAIRITEGRTGGFLIEPTPPVAGTSQFPTPPVNLEAGEFFLYVYQVKSPSAAGTFQLSLGESADLPALTSTVEVLTDLDAEARETELTIEVNSGEPSETFIRIAELTVHFTASKPDNVSDIRNLGAPRFRYSLERVTEMLDCLRASLLAEPGSLRPGHALITFNDLEISDLKPIGATAAHGSSFTVPHGDHVHALLLHEPSGLQFTGEGNNELWINGDVGGEAINFRNTVRGQDPVAPQHLATKRYVDAHIAGLDWQESVLDKDLTVAPAGPKAEDRYLLFNEPTTEWRGQRNSTGHKNQIATFTGKFWEFTTPDEGTATFVEDENIAYMFVDGSWIPFVAVPEITAGDGLVAAGAVLSVGKGNGIVVKPDDVSVAFEASEPQPIGPVASAGSHDTSARGDHAHQLLLANKGGLEFAQGALQVNGPIAGNAIAFENVVSGQQPTLDHHLATKKYVDDHQPTITAGAGLVRIGDVISVKPGAGITFEQGTTFEQETTLAIKAEPIDEVANAVAVAFQTVEPQPIGPVANAGTPSFVSPGDHVHRLPLAANSGLEFASGALRLNGPVAGDTIEFQRAVSGQTPIDARHLATKQYVDSKLAPTANIVAGLGLTRIGDTLAVSAGPGLLVEEDLVSVRFSTAPPRPDIQNGDPGNEPASARADHSHPQPQNTTGATTGLVEFNIDGNMSVVQSDFIDPGLKDGTISVQLALVTTPDNYFFDMDGQFINLPPIRLSAEVSLKGPTGFRIWAWTDRSKEQPLPPAFQVRWFAYWPGGEAPFLRFRFSGESQ